MESAASNGAPSQSEANQVLSEAFENLEKELQCSICLAVFVDPQSLPCNHQFCRPCILQAFASMPEQMCPECKQPAFKRSIRKSHKLENLLNAYRNLKSIVEARVGIISNPTSKINTAYTQSRVYLARQQSAQLAMQPQPTPKRARSTNTPRRSQSTPTATSTPSMSGSSIPRMSKSKQRPEPSMTTTSTTNVTPVPRRRRPKFDPITGEPLPKKPRGRPKGSKNRAKGAEEVVESSTPVNRRMRELQELLSDKQRYDRHMHDSQDNSDDSDDESGSSDDDSESGDNMELDTLSTPAATSSLDTSTSTGKRKRETPAKSAAITAVASSAATTPIRSFLRPDEIVICCSNLSDEEQKSIEKAVKSLGGSFRHEFSNEVTHVVMGAVKERSNKVPRTLKYLKGVLWGKWVVQYPWIRESKKRGRWLDPTAWEVKYDTFGFSGTHRSRTIDESEATLFHEKRFLFAGSFTSASLPPVNELTEMLEDAGGDVLSKMPKKHVDLGVHAHPLEDLIVLVDRASPTLSSIPINGFRTVLDCSWVVDSISSYTLLDITDYRVPLSSFSNK